MSRFSPCSTIFESLNGIRSEQSACLVLRTLMLSLIVLIVGCTQRHTEEELIQHGRDLQAKKDYATAIIELKNALQQYPNSAAARLLLGEIYTEVSQGPDAEKELLRAKELGAQRVDYMIPLTRAYLLENKVDDALNEAEILPEMNPGAQALVLALQGQCYLRKNELIKAREAFGAAFALDSDVAEAQLGSAIMESAEGNNTAAREWLEKATTAHPDQPEAWELLGDLERLEKNTEAADKAYGNAIEKSTYNSFLLHYKRALLRLAEKDIDGALEDIGEMERSGPQHPLTHYAKGLSLILQQQYEQAQNEFQQTLSKLPDMPGALLQMGTLSYIKKQNEQAENYLTRVLKIVPNVDSARIMLAITRMRLNDPVGAESAIVPVVEQNPYNVVALNLLGNIYMAQGKNDEGIRYLQQAVNIQPDNPRLRTRLALSFLRDGARDKGVKELQDVIDVDPEFVQPELILVTQYLQDGDYDRALSLAKEIRNKQPDNVIAINLVAGTHLLRGDVDEARQLFQEVLDKQPTNSTAAFNLANIAIRQKAFDEARKIYQSVLDHAPDDILTLVRLAALEDVFGNTKRARELLDHAVATSPNSPIAQVNMARHLLRHGNSAQALATIQEVSAAYPNAPSILEAKAAAQLDQQDYKGAMSTLQRLVKIAPNSPSARYLLASAYEKSGDDVHFRSELEKTLELDPGYLLARLTETRLRARDGDIEGAMAEFDQLHKEQPGNPNIWAEEGKVALEAKDYDRALAAYKKANEIAPSSKTILMQAEVLTAAGNRKAGIEFLEQWVADNPKDLIVLGTLANIYGASGESAKQQAALTRVAELDSSNPLALNALAWSLRNESDITDAVGYAERAHQIAPKLPQIADTLGVLRLRQDNPNAAIELFESALQTLPDNPDIQTHLAQALVQSGKTAEARKILTKVTSSGTDFSEKEQALALLKELE